MDTKSYKSQAELLLNNYLFADSSVASTSILFGIFACKTVYDLSQLVSSSKFKGYSNLSQLHQIEWNNRAMSTFHAVFIAVMSLYFFLWSDLYSDDQLRGPFTLRSSTSSKFALGVSLGYFISDFSMIIWFYPSLGGIEYIVHHLLSVGGVAFAVLTGEAQLYTFMVLLSEATTPGINLRWYLDTAGKKSSRVYIVNGIGIFLTWLVARILWFIYMFFHAYQHSDQVKKMQITGILLVLIAPAVLSVMNLIWFWKIFKGLVRTLEKRHQK